jgi:hypothetical protein
MMGDGWARQTALGGSKDWMEDWGLVLGLGCLGTSWLDQIADVRFWITVFSNDRADRVVVALGWVLEEHGTGRPVQRTGVCWQGK